MMWAFICLILIPVGAIYVSIDEEILGNSTSPHTFNFFQINSKATVEIKLEYDMILSIDQYKALTSRPKGQLEKRAAIRDSIYKWPNEKVYFEITRSVSSQRETILRAIGQWQNCTCIEFIENNISSSRISFVYGYGSCSSYVGCRGWVQEIYIGGCSYRSTLHEIGHALGLYHEHVRIDRDFYIRIDESQIRNHNFEIKSFEEINSIGIEYDYMSIMHYSRRFITTLDVDYINKIGRNPVLSFKDIKVINLLYQCRNKHGKCPPIICPFNGFVFCKPLNGMPKCTCWCESGSSSDPLIPCYQIDREVPGPNIPARSSNSELKITVCSDLRGNCADLKEKGMCRTYFQMMYKECTKTCNFCGKGDNLCMDYEEGCRIMAGSGACKEEGLEEIMSKLCQKSCDLCRRVSTPCDIEEAMFGPSQFESRNNGDSNKMKWITIFYVLLIVCTCQL